MKLPYRIGQASTVLYRLGVSYHAHGIVKEGKAAMYLYFQCDRLTDEQFAKIQEFCPDAIALGVQHKNAPEIKRVHILFPKAAWYRANKGAKA